MASFFDLSFNGTLKGRSESAFMGAMPRRVRGAGL
jgi:hypothetical protein